MHKTYGPKAVCQLVGISQRQLGYWGMIGVIQPEKQMHGAKIFNRYTEEDIATLKKVKGLIEEGFFVSKAAEKVRLLKEGKAAGTTAALLMGKKEETKPLSTDNSQVLFTPLHFEVWLNKQVAKLCRGPFPLTCMASQVVIPPFIKLLPEKSDILFKLSNEFISMKRSEEIIGYQRDCLFLWLMPNRSIEAARYFSEELRRLMENRTWEVQGKRLQLQFLFGFSDFQSLSKREGTLLIEAEKDLTHQSLQKKPIHSIKNGVTGPSSPFYGNK
ncbi:MAG: MerR family transcriptional regulator [Candidatus Manganitrophaceae bacterium]